MINMSVFLDTGFILALKNSVDKNFESTQFWMRRFLKNEFRQIYTSFFIFNELVTFTLIRIKNPNFTKNIREHILISQKINLLNVDQEDFDNACTYF